jgi:hypothetical protein
LYDEIFFRNVLTSVIRSLKVGDMSHRNTANAMTAKNQLALVSGLVSARQIAILVLVLVLLITNGGAG